MLQKDQPITISLTYIKCPLFFNTTEGAILKTQNSAQGNKGVVATNTLLVVEMVGEEYGHPPWS